MKHWLRSKEFWLVVGLTVLNGFLHFWRLGEPGEVVFDETYYPKWGQDYLQGQSFFDVHPPLGKLLIALSVWAFNANPEAGIGAFGWRFTTALFGTLFVPLTFVIAKKIFAQQDTRDKIQETNEESRSAATNPPFAIHYSLVPLLASLFVMLDGLLLVQGRIALLDSFVVVFMLAAYATFLMYRDAATAHHAKLWLAATGIFFGLSIATKWTGVAVVGVTCIWLLANRNKFPRVSALTLIATYMLIPAAVYISSFVFNERVKDLFSYLLEWHTQTWLFHQNLHSSHPYESRWWTWLYLARPVWYYYKDDGGIIRGIIALGNPLLWWASIGALIASVLTVVRRRAPELMLPLLAFFATYAPWWLIGRTQFQYYLVGGVPFLFMLLAYWLDRGYQRPSYRPVVVTFVVAAVVAFIFFFPILTAYPISNGYYRLHIWFSTWI